MCVCVFVRVERVRERCVCGERESDEEREEREEK